MWTCLECGRGFMTAKAAERAANKGCPGCGGVDVDFVPVVRPGRRPNESLNPELEVLLRTVSPKLNNEVQ